MATPTKEPARIYAGATLKWDKTTPDYDNGDGYTLEYVFYNSGKKFTISSSSSDGTKHSISETDTATASYTPGFYNWTLFAIKSGERNTVEEGTIEIRPDIGDGTATGYDSRSHVRRMVELLREGIEKLGARQVSKWSIDGASYERADLPQMVQLLQHYEQREREELTKEKLAAGLGNPNRIRVRFQA